MRRDKIPKLDLHGRSADEIFNLLDQFLRQNKTKEQVLIVVGKGRGIVKQKSLEYLRKAGYSWRDEKVRGMPNKGALIVDLL